VIVRIDACCRRRRRYVHVYRDAGWADGTNADSGIDTTDHLCERYWAETVNLCFDIKYLV